MCIDKETVRQILYDHLQMIKVCAMVVPKLLNSDQKEKRQEICADILKQIQKNLKIIDCVMICDETCIFQCDPETKRQSMHCKTHHELRMQDEANQNSRQC